MAALALAGAYVLVGLGAGSEPSSSDTATPLGGADLPLDAGRPDSSRVTGSGGLFAVAVPPDWEQSGTDFGDTLFAAPDGEAEVLVRVSGSSQIALGEQADRATSFLAGELAPGAELSRLRPQLEGALLAVARSSGGGEQSTAYVAAAEGTRYLLISTHAEDASTLRRLQADELIRSFEPGAR